MQKRFFSTEFLANDLKSLFFPEGCLWYKSDNLLAIPQGISSVTSDPAFFISLTFNCLNASSDASNLLLKVFHLNAFVPRMLPLSHTQFWLAISCATHCTFITHSVLTCNQLCHACYFYYTLSSDFQSVVPRMLLLSHTQFWLAISCATHVTFITHSVLTCNQLCHAYYFYHTLSSDLQSVVPRMLLYYTLSSDLQSFVPCTVLLSHTQFWLAMSCATNVTFITHSVLTCNQLCHACYFYHIISSDLQSVVPRTVLLSYTQFWLAISCATNVTFITHSVLTCNQLCHALYFYHTLSSDLQSGGSRFELQIRAHYWNLFYFSISFTVNFLLYVTLFAVPLYLTFRLSLPCYLKISETGMS